jgi:ABC-type glycerol-3-phosphate transport system substrate-binding protein
MWGGKSSDLDTWELSSRNLGFVPYPQSLGANRYFEYQGYMISVGTQHPQEAWRWISWLSYQDIPPFGLSYSTNTLPPRRSVAEASNAWQRLNPDVAAAFRWVFDNVSDFSPPLNDILVDGSFANCIRRGIDKALLAVLVDRESAEVALAQAQAWVMDQFVNAIEQQAALEAHPIVVHTSRPELRPLADGIEIEFLISTGDVKPYKELAKDFQQEHPEISVHVELHGPSLTKTHRQPQLDIMAQRAPCFEGVPTISLIDRQMLLDLTPLLESDPRLSQEDFFAVFLYPLLWDDQLLGLPALGSVPLIAYNRELFDRLGHPYPPLDWDWDDFLRFSQLLAADGETGKCYAYSGFSEVLDLFRILRGYDAYPWEMGYIAQPRFSDPRVVATVEWYVNLHRVHGIKPQYRLAQPSYDELQETISLILKERVAMWDSNIPLVPPGEELPFEVGYTAYPVKRGFYIGDIPWSTAYFISSHATPKEIEACWTWLTYLSEHVLPLSEYTYTWNNAVPARRDTAKSDAYRVRMGEDRYAAILHTLEHFRPPEEMINADAAMFYRWVPPADWFLQAVEAVVEGEAAETALMRAQEKAMAYIICFDNAAPGDDPRQTAKTCAQQVDPGYQMPGGE